MTKLFLPLVLIAAAVLLFVVYTNPAYQASKALSTQVSSYDDALSKSQQLKSVRDQLLSRRNTFSPDNVTKLEHILPDNVDNIRLIIDINNIATRHGLSLGGVQLGSVSDSRKQKSTLAVGTSGDAVGSVDVSFSVNASYDNFRAFLADLEHSLRLIDVEKIDFQASGAGADVYNFTIRTYWLH